MKVIAAIVAAICFAMGASTATFDLATIRKNTSFPNGAVLTGTHGGGCQILIADGATVTLQDATIKRTSSGGKYAGITCEGNATINLVGANEVTAYHTSRPAIYVPPGKTLTIRNGQSVGSGSLTPNGKAVATLTYNTGKKSKGKVVYYKPSCSTVVLQQNPPDIDYFTGRVNFYFAPSTANNFPGWSGYEVVP